MHLPFEGPNIQICCSFTKTAPCYTQQNSLLILQTKLSPSKYYLPKDIHIDSTQEQAKTKEEQWVSNTLKLGHHTFQK